MSENKRHNIVFNISVCSDAELSTYHPNMKSSALMAASLSAWLFEYGSNQWEISVMPMTPFWVFCMKCFEC